MDKRWSGGLGDSRAKPMIRPVSSGGPGSGGDITPISQGVSPSVVCGFAYAFHVVDGRPAMAKGIEKILQNCEIIIKTLPGQYPFLPDFGCNLGYRVFSPISAHALAAHDIRIALTRWEPRVEVLGITTDTSQADQGILGLTVELKIDNEAELTTLNTSVRRIAA
jgi:phage baseplate assembly protein W